MERPPSLPFLRYVSDVHGCDVDGLGPHSLVYLLPSIRCDAYERNLNRLFVRTFLVCVGLMVPTHTGPPYRAVLKDSRHCSEQKTYPLNRTGFSIFWPQFEQYFM